MFPRQGKRINSVALAHRRGAGDIIGWSDVPQSPSPSPPHQGSPRGPRFGSPEHADQFPVGGKMAWEEEEPPRFHDHDDRIPPAILARQSKEQKRWDSFDHEFDRRSSSPELEWNAGVERGSGGKGLPLDLLNPKPLSFDSQPLPSQRPPSALHDYDQGGAGQPQDWVPFPSRGSNYQSPTAILNDITLDRNAFM